MSIEGKRSQQGQRPVTIPGIPTTHDKGGYDMQQWNATVTSGLVAGVAMCNFFLRTSEIMFLYQRQVKINCLFYCLATPNTPSWNEKSRLQDKRGAGRCYSLTGIVQSPAVATQHLRPAGLGHVNPTTASAWPVLPALPCDEQSKHHVTRTGEATEHMAEGRSELLHPAQILHSPAHWVGRAGRVHIERPETGVAQHDRIRRAPPPARFSSAVNAERHAMQ